MVYLHTRETIEGKSARLIYFQVCLVCLYSDLISAFQSIHLIPFLALNLCVRRGLKAQIAKSKQETSPDERFFTLKIFNESKMNIFFFQEGWK
jgi:hypothetical protein